ncbi:Flp family type IVb pilin [Cupriavidus oxalaticus]|uniref:Flp family type IVb pilin n=1 Tax=Cupriavidus oxalaticus TaxID=96344 RepID=A0A375G953_9BURK|nr:Flp family type IVb pilin [Cupriavidus oxalaticus]QRQ86758.1 Flp family type IVb pilin [Cupriavidus oxalaticus]QRQ94914.1 Flp family type IVb pilin [Cupriavidus oxalaticus]WQD83568.1 Flp family type IVb pilin [Cupriavidus oxalaticus]SPC16818.1 Flp/Fap pilin protein [Cupriavidus oxalaticus]
MRTIIAKWKALQRDEHGVTAIEYALIGALIAMVIVVTVGFLGTKVNELFEAVVAVMPAMP